MQNGQTLETLCAVNPAHLLVPDFGLALALLTLGCKLDQMVNGGGPVEFREEVREGVERRFQWVFDPAVEVDGVAVSEWRRRWNDPAWFAANPTSPLAWLRKFVENQAAFGEWMKRHDPVFVFRNVESGETERVAYVPESMMGTDRGNQILRGAGLAA